VELHDVHERDGGGDHRCVQRVVTLTGPAQVVDSVFLAGRGIVRA
jgi:hypothetical protein